MRFDQATSVRGNLLPRGDIIAGLSAPSFVVVASALTLIFAVLAGQVESNTRAAPAATRAAAEPTRWAPDPPRPAPAVHAQGHAASAPSSAL